MTDATTPLSSRLNYAQCWEDPELLLTATAPGPGDRVLSIASAGDNAIALAMTGAQVDAVDVSEAQLALVALKLSGARLTYGDFRGLLGVQTAVDPVRVYRLIRKRLPEFAQRYWDAHEDVLAAGVLGQGRFERYLSTFGRRVLPLVHRRSTTRRWFELNTRAEREQFWRRWDNRRWRALFKLFFSQRVMSARGRSPEQFAHVEGGIAGALMDRTRRVLTELDPRENGYVQWILLGQYLNEASEPAYLRADGHKELREVAQRVTLIHTDLMSHMATQSNDVYAAFNLSDVPEYLDREGATALLREAARTGRPGARLAYWNLFVPRCRPEELASQLHRKTELALSLYARDRSFFYGGFQVEEVR